MSFNPITNPVDYILLSNQRSPGIAEISNLNSPRRWDERRGFALSGARVIYRGVGLARPVVTLKFYSTEDFDDWNTWRALVQRAPVGERARAQDIWHPELEDMGVTSVVVEDVVQPRQVGDGEWHTTIRFIEYRRPVFTIESIGSAQERETLTENEIRIQELEAERDRLAGS